VAFIKFPADRSRLPSAILTDCAKRDRNIFGISEQAAAHAAVMYATESKPDLQYVHHHGGRTFTPERFYPIPFPNIPCPVPLLPLLERKKLSKKLI